MVTMSLAVYFILMLLTLICGVKSKDMEDQMYFAGLCFLWTIGALFLIGGIACREVQ